MIAIDTINSYVFDTEEYEFIIQQSLSPSLSPVSFLWILLESAVTLDIMFISKIVYIYDKLIHKFGLFIGLHAIDY